jgi:hypothetical protein
MRDAGRSNSNIHPKEGLWLDKDTNNNNLPGGAVSQCTLHHNGCAPRCPRSRPKRVSVLCILGFESVPFGRGESEAVWRC